MWFIFPQLAGFGTSAMAQHYAISGLDEARAYLRHPDLGERLRTCTAAVNAVTGRTAYQVFGSPDDMKFRSSMTLFGRAELADPTFKEALARYYGASAHYRAVLQGICPAVCPDRLAGVYARRSVEPAVSVRTDRGRLPTSRARGSPRRSRPRRQEQKRINLGVRGPALRGARNPRSRSAQPWQHGNRTFPTCASSDMVSGRAWHGRQLQNLIDRT
ncbi:uncharacterized protein (DUF1810 family) [Methylobacterium sp. RAS18]|nr:uncharacterized protein (DUF1810 family) [Methylobacterium sp. RAS18]